MDPLGQPLGHPYGVHVPPAAGISLYPAGLGPPFPPSAASHVQYGLPPPAFQLSYHHPPPSYPLVGPPQSAAVPIQAPPGAAPPAKGFFSPWEAAPPPMPPPLDFELEKRIEKLVEYVAKNGPQFETMMKEKQIGNPAYAFLFGAEGHGYYRYRLWLHVNGHVNAASNATLSAVHPGLPSYNSLSLHTGLRAPGLSVSALNPQIAPPSLSLASGVGLPSGSFPSGHENIQSQQLLLHQQQQPLPLLDRTQKDVGYGSMKDDNEPFKGLGGPLPPDVAAELDEVLRDLTGTKESIKGAKTWFMQRSIFSPALAEALCDYVLATADAERQLHVIYLVNDILFSSLQKRINMKELDNEAFAFKPFLGAMLGAIYHNTANAEANRDRLVKILGFWGVKEVYDTDTMNLLEGEMMSGPSARARKPSSANQSAAFLPGSGLLGSVTLAPPNQSPAPYPGQWEPERTSLGVEQQMQDQHQHSYSGVSSDHHFSAPNTQFGMPANQQSTATSSVPTLYSSLSSSFLPPLPTSSSVTQSVAQPTPSITLDKSPYPHFPPGLIPGIVRKVQIGSGVPYSPVSPLDIPTAIPPSTVTESYILDRVAKFFRDIGEVDPLQGQQRASYEADTKEEVEETGRKGGARIPPPNMHYTSEAGTDYEGRMKGLGSQTAEFGTNAFDELARSDDAYNSYRKQSSSNYHTTFSARAAAR